MRIFGIEYNILQYLRDNNVLQFDVKTNGATPEDTRDVVYITLDGGAKQNDAYSLARPSIQILARSKSSEKAKKQVFEIFSLLDNKFGITLPEYSDGTYEFEEVVIPQISAMQIPSYIGADQNFVHMWVCNFILTGVLEH